MFNCWPSQSKYFLWFVLNFQFILSPNTESRNGFLSFFGIFVVQFELTIEFPPLFNSRLVVFSCWMNLACGFEQEFDTLPKTTKFEHQKLEMNSSSHCLIGSEMMTFASLLSLTTCSLVRVGTYINTRIQSHHKLLEILLLLRMCNFRNRVNWKCLIIQRLWQTQAKKMTLVCDLLLFVAYQLTISV